MNKQKRELMKKLQAMTEDERAEYHKKEAETDRQWKEDCQNYPELFSFFYDSYSDLNERNAGFSPLSKAARDKIRKKYEKGEYPERLHSFVMMELDLKDPRF